MLGCLFYLFYAHKKHILYNLFIHKKINKQKDSKITNKITKVESLGKKNLTRREIMYILYATQE